MAYNLPTLLHRAVGQGGCRFVRGYKLVGFGMVVVEAQPIYKDATVPVPRGF
jgi:hypothetical protein